MDYITVKEAAAKWGISERWVHKLCQDNRIKGQMRFSNVWMIPTDAEKPTDPRLKNKRLANTSKDTEGEHGNK